MSYQVLARKWRPKRFAELVGQEHVVRALTHALETGRIHHAFLFTGTRGVGKTTIARIFAKSLNCERGVSAEPCGECATCRDIDAGRFLDLLEIDAASNTGVDDVRVLIENAQYSPARGNFKVYLVDEVHMLSKNAFNALLKTLEEPPAHAKFLLATTDPQKLPVTVLSRCLQFNLKRLTMEQIESQLSRILAAEAIAADAGAVRALARAGNGSLRDALSLLDQAIAFGHGEVRGDDVTAMLGTVDRDRVEALLAAVVAGDAPALLAEIEQIAQFAPDFATVLDELAELLHRVQVAQFVPDARADDAAVLAGLAGSIAADEVQLLYQLALTGRRDLGMAASPRAAFEMALLRMLAFRPAAGGEPSRSDAPRRAVSPPATATRRGAAGALPAASTEAPTARVPEAPPRAAAAVVAVPQRGVEPAAVAPARDATPRTIETSDWLEVIDRSGMRGPLRELALNSVPLGLDGDRLRLGLKPSHEHFRSDAMTRQLADALAPSYGPLRILFESVGNGAESAADRARRQQSARQAQAEAAIAADPVVQALMNRFDARVVPNSTRPRNTENER
ncbi:MAG TPA: DNA polymerase III subunit gamma/tau [Xanthomonadales bacterium]|nr:DNA polymerase III subunit gamma/tau [Xanthomonadales bacterium]